MKTLANQYRLIKEGKGHKGVFLKEAKAKFPNLLKNNSTFKEATTILKQKNIISENFIGMPMVGNPVERKKEGYEKAFENFIAEAEAKAEEKKVSKEVEEDAEKNYDYKDKKDPNNMIFGQIQMGYYYEMKQEKNADKTVDEIKDIVFKNLAKDPIYYTKNGQFGEDVGYTEDNVSLGVPKEAKGKYKSSGYGNLKENSISVAGGLVTDHVFSSRDYKDFFGLNEITKEESEEIASNLKSAEESAEKIASLEEDEMQDVGGYKMTWQEDLADAAEQAYDALGNKEDVAEFVVQHLGLKMGD
jgi:hypothetical protein